MKDLYLVNCCRTAIGSFGGSLKNTSAADMGAVVVKEALKRANVAPENVDELMFGCILTAAQGQNVARQVSPSSLSARRSSRNTSTSRPIYCSGVSSRPICASSP